jgi:hypothetical protein
MGKALIIEPSLMGRKFEVNNIEYTCIGFGQNESFIVFGAVNDTTNDRFNIKSFKMVDVKFIGQI